jgi:hypothetical protein
MHKIKNDHTFKFLASKRQEFLEQANKVFDSSLYEVTQNEKTSRVAQNGNCFVPYQFIFNVGCEFVTGEILPNGFIKNPSETETLSVKKECYLNETTVYSI